MMKLPPPLSWLWDAWMAFSRVLGFVMSRIILTILWIVGFGIYGIILKVVGLFSKKESGASMWIDCEPVKSDSLKHQF
jgi:hypothetical protein